MLSKKKRLNLKSLKVSDFFAHATKIHSPYYTIFFQLNELNSQDSSKDEQPIKVSVLVTKKVSLKAVIRNKIKRQFYEIIQFWGKEKWQDQVTEKQCQFLRMIIVVKPAILQLKYATLLPMAIKSLEKIPLPAKILAKVTDKVAAKTADKTKT